MATGPVDGPELSESLRGFARLWWLVLLAGALGVVAGVVVLVVPDIGLVTLAVVSGTFLLVDGIFELIASLGPHMEHRGLLALTGIVTAIIGILLVRHPIEGVVATALLLGFWLLALGIIRFIEGFSAEHRGWALAVAAVEVVAGVVIATVPGIAVATLALLVGFAFILRGAAMCGLGWSLRELRAAA
jgi:uncharacterized membrane protein HdeD (DUF308 family)